MRNSGSHTAPPTALVARLGAALGIALLAAATAAQPLDRARLEALSQRQLPRSWAMLHEFLSLANDAHFPEQVEQNVAWVRRAFEARGFAIEVLDTGGPPLLLATRRTPGSPRTLLVYLQIDGQPVDPDRWEQASPFQPALKQRQGESWQEIPWQRLESGFDPEWRVFARSAADAKGPALMFLTALDALAGAGLEPSFDLKVVMDFEEELGSPHLPQAVGRHREALAADAMLIFDGPRHASNRPTLDFGARGIVDVTLTVFGPRAPQHSGHYGNWVPNPALRLAQLLASMKDERGRVTLPGFYDGVELDAATRAVLAGTPDDEAAIRRSLGIAGNDAVGATLQEAIQYPSLNVRGLAAAWVGEQARTVIPESASAEIDIRLVPESDAERLVALVRDHVAAQGYHLIAGEQPSEQERQQHPRLASFRHRVSYGAFRTRYDSEVGVWLTAALERAFGSEPVRIRMGGGSIPIAPFVVELGVPAVAVPTVQKDNNQHGPNENLRLGNYAEGVQTYLAILTQPTAGR